MENMKLVIAIVRDIDASPVVETLVAQHYRVTRVASTGGFLRRGYVTLLIGVEESHVEAVMDILRATCSPAEPGSHRATVFVLNAPYFEQV